MEDPFSLQGAPDSNNSIKFVLVRFLVGSGSGQVGESQLFLSPGNTANRANVVQNHHLIPTELISGGDLAPFLTELSTPTEPGSRVYDHRDFLTNGAPLQTTAADSLRMGVAQHSGPHDSYTRYVEAQLVRPEQHPSY